MGGKGSGQPKDTLMPYQVGQIKKTPSEGFMEDAIYISKLNEIRRKADKTNIDTLYECLSDYLMLCQASGRMVVNESLYMACGVTTGEVSQWYTGARKSNNPAYREFASFAKQICSVSTSEALAMGRLHPAVGIFWGKAYQGLTDQPQPQIEYKGEEEIEDIETIKNKYSDLIDDD